jgi:branched-chain amino acid aminotransferase
MNYLNNILAKIEAIDHGVLEAIMLNHQGNVAECTGDNLFVVRQNAQGRTELVTPPASAGALEGVTMTTVLSIAAHMGIQAGRAELKPDDVFNAKEVFLTGTAAEVIPAVQLDRRVIGSGKPGPVTAQVVAAFHELVKHDGTPVPYTA